ncbi:MAG TPA: homoserine kinase [Leucothrix mucor]|nr:homoserine kinase [Leucothrix mucor]
MSVYTTVSSEELSSFLLAYNVGELVDFLGISAGMENTNYFVETSKGSFVLTLYEHHSAEELPFFLELMHHLSMHNVETITPVADKQGGLFGQLCGKPAALIERLSGASLKPSEATPEHCRLIGNALARFHLAGMSYDNQRENQRSKDLSPEFISTFLSKLNEEDKQLLEQELAFQKSINWSDLATGITHSDLFCDNSMFDDVSGKLVLTGIIDLYFACNDAFIFDLATVAMDWCSSSDGSFDEERLMALLLAYNDVRKLETLERQAWHAMLRTSILRFWAFRLDMALNPRGGDLVLRKDPDELKIKLQGCLREKDSIMNLMDKIN